MPSKCSFRIFCTPLALPYEAAQNSDTIVLVTGDGDFDVLLARIRARFNTRSVVYGVPALTSTLLVEEADQFVPIEPSLLMG